MTDNAWRPDQEQNQGSFSDPSFWMTRQFADGWQIHIRLETDGYQTVIAELHIHPGDTNSLVGIRGHIEVPTGNPQDPSWQRITLPATRRQASTALREELLEMQRNRQPFPRPQDSPPPPVHNSWAIFAHMRGFTPTGTTHQPRRRRPRDQKQLDLAIIAAAYTDALTDPKPRQPRQGTLNRLAQTGRYYSDTSIGPLITHARNAGLLTPTTRGKAAGTLTPKARTILSEAGFDAVWRPGRRLFETVD